jgi:hypothetical protein
MESRVRVFYDNVMLGKLLHITPDCRRYVAIRHLGTIPGPSAFHLVENRVVALVDGISAVHIGRDKIAIAFVGTEGVCLVGAGMGS